MVATVSTSTQERKRWEQDHVAISLQQCQRAFSSGNAGAGLRCKKVDRSATNHWAVANRRKQDQGDRGLKECRYAQLQQLELLKRIAGHTGSKRQLCAVLLNGVVHLAGGGDHQSFVAMFSPPPQVTASSLHSQSLSHGGVDIHNSRGESKSTGSWTALRKIGLIRVNLQSEEWKTVIKAIDLSELKHLELYKSNITHEALKLLVDRIPDNNTSKVSFKTLNIRSTELVNSADSRAVIKELRRKASLIEIIGAS
ncbi:hypothetical protein BGZ65_010099 [Modicella reniformis]|uniref:Uncharacterized protein n=1 Tax=Modicella reniformis TaxID=1440133 RepID=A0A9P6LSW0_9FUNG|nr:hypothetical protein BGZ65_010099 [Modicella reniformis]